jgi:hypothetical protein
MIARFDHRPMLTAALALTTTLLFVVVVTLSTLLITAAPPAATSTSESGGGNPGAAAVPANMDAGGESYGYNIYRAARGDSQKSDSAERQEVGHP